MEYCGNEDSTIHFYWKVSQNGLTFQRVPGYQNKQWNMAVGILESEGAVPSLELETWTWRRSTTSFWRRGSNSSRINTSKLARTIWRPGSSDCNGLSSTFTSPALNLYGAVEDWECPALVTWDKNFIIILHYKIMMGHQEFECMPTLKLNWAILNTLNFMHISQTVKIL